MRNEVYTSKYYGVKYFDWMNQRILNIQHNCIIRILRMNEPCRMYCSQTFKDAPLRRTFIVARSLNRIRLAMTSDLALTDCSFVAAIL